MSNWNHAICYRCWLDEKPDREPSRAINGDFEVCCFCGAVTKAGIYVRRDPKKCMFCDHEED